MEWRQENFSTKRHFENMRRQANLTYEQVASMIGATVASVKDIEFYEEGLYNQIRMATAFRACDLFGSTPLELYGIKLKEGSLSLEELTSSVDRHIKHTNTTANRFEDESGWSLSVLKNPQELLNNPFAAIVDICEPLSINPGRVLLWLWENRREIKKKRGPLSRIREFLSNPGR